jgi:hypothetical protein
MFLGTQGDAAPLSLGEPWLDQKPTKLLGAKAAGTTLRMHHRLAFLALAACLSLPSAVRAELVPVLVLKEHGVGMAALAQPFVDRMIALTAKQNGWTDAKGMYFTTRAAAEALINTEKPHYGILSLGAFLAWRKNYGLEPLGIVNAVRAGGRRYAIISKTATDLAECKGKSLASDHIDDARFIEKVVSGGDFKLGDFKTLQTQRPLQAIKKVVAGDADCALIDDAQMEELDHLEEGKSIKTVWQSRELPSMLVAAFPAAGKDERERFEDNLEKVCAGEAKSACTEVGILSLRAERDGDLEKLIAEYEK